MDCIAGSNFAGNLAGVLLNNVIAIANTGVLVQSDGLAHLDTDVITGSGSGGVHVLNGSLAAFGLVVDDGAALRDGDRREGLAVHDGVHLVRGERRDYRRIVADYHD